MTKHRPHNHESFCKILIVLVHPGWPDDKILAGVAEVAAQRRWLLHLLQTKYNVWSGYDAWQPDGVLLGPGMYYHLRPRIARMSAALVSFNMDLTSRGIPSVVVDDAAVGVLAARHLLSCNLKHFAVVGAKSAAASEVRLTAFRQTVEQAGFPCLRTLESLEDIPINTNLLEAQMARFPRPIGLFVFNDSWALPLVSICRKVHLRIPEDVAVVGVNNTELVCNLCSPPISSVAIPWGQVGLRAARLLEECIHRRKKAIRDGRPADPPSLTGPVRVAPLGVVVRQSSDILHVADPEVAAALAYIHRHADHPITMPELYRNVAVGRRTIERGFRRLLGRTPNAEIRRVHVEQAKRLLETTDLAMSDIARLSGLVDARKLAIHFRRETGQTASTYRRKFHALD